MAIKDIIARGIGFSPGSIKFIPTHGFIASAIVPTAAIYPGSVLITRLGPGGVTITRRGPGSVKVALRLE